MRINTLVFVKNIEIVEEPPTHKGLFKITYKNDKNEEIVFIGGVCVHGILSEGEDTHFELFFEQVKS